MFLIRAFAFLLLVISYGCSSSNNSNVYSLDNGKHHALIIVSDSSKGIDTPLYGFVVLKDEYVTEIDSENGKIFNLGIYHPSKLDRYNRFSIMKNEGGINYSIQLLTSGSEGQEIIHKSNKIISVKKK